MPIYGYTCKNCEHTVDVLQKISDAPLIHCPSCGAPGLKRLLSAPRFRLKGQGWYETDFKKDKQRNLAGDKEPAKKDDAEKDVTKKDDVKKVDKSPGEKPATDTGGDKAKPKSSAKSA